MVRVGKKRKQLSDRRSNNSDSCAASFIQRQQLDVLRAPPTLAGKAAKENAKRIQAQRFAPPPVVCSVFDDRSDWCGSLSAQFDRQRLCRPQLSPPDALGLRLSTPLEY
jgi:hypothetical protein